MSLASVAIQTASSFGPDLTTMGPEFSAHSIFTSVRFRMLDRRGAYYACTQHDHRAHDFDGRPMQQGDPMLGSPNLASQPSDVYVPLRERRPSAPYRLPRVITDSFTNLVFGYQRWPTIRSPGDPETERFSRALADAQHLRTLMIRARTIGGSTGTSCLSWRFWRGKPRTQVHNPKYVYVHSWLDRETCEPEHVSEIYKYVRDEWNAESRRFEPVWYWFRRDWTPDADVAFKEIRIETDVEPKWQVNDEETYKHDDGYPHFVWIQNLPSERPEEIDGLPDYEGLYEVFDSIDVLNSVLVRGTILNLDPTLVLKVDPDLVARTGVQKGSENALSVGPNGDAHFMELQGTSVQAGTSLFGKLRETALEVAQCVVPDPNQVGASGTSSVALKVVYAPMLGKADILREQYENGLARLLGQQVRSARRLRIGEVIDDVDQDGAPVRRVAVLALPPVIEERDVTDPATGEPTGEKVREEVELRPGPTENFAFDWGDYFLPTASDQQQTATTLATLATSKLLSQESGADLAARALRIDPRADWDRIKSEKDAQASTQATMFSDPGVPVDGPDGLPDDAGARGAEQDAMAREAVEELAHKMTTHGVERCEHGRANRCWLCGIERTRDFAMGADGSAQWAIGWRPILNGERS